MAPLTLRWSFVVSVEKMNVRRLKFDKTQSVGLKNKLFYRSRTKMYSD